MINFDPIYDMLDRIDSLNEDEAWILVIDAETQDFIVEMNKHQLFEEGRFSDNKDTPDYSPITVVYKIMRGDRYDHMTFKDTGEFYESFHVIVDRSGFEIMANGQVSGDTNLFEVYGENILGLTADSLEKLKELILIKYVDYIREKLLL